MRMIHSVVIREKPPSKRPRKQSSKLGQLIEFQNNFALHVRHAMNKI